MRDTLLLFLILLFCNSCDNEPPYVKNPIYNVIVYEPGGALGNSGGIFLSVHFVLYDENGLEDIQEIQLVNMDQDYCWSLKREDLEITEWENELYYGYSFFEYDHAKAVLLGNYLIRVFDKAGNITDTALLVEIEGVDNKKEYRPAVPEYAIKTKENRKEIEIEKLKYRSCEIKFPNDLNQYKNSRKKFESNERIVLSDKEIEAGTVVSLRINSDFDDRLIFFLKNYKMK